MRRFAFFCVGGGLAFLVDAGVLHLLVGPVGLSPYTARLCSFISAVTTTWLFNRSFTFSTNQVRDLSPLEEWARYVISQLGGFAVNYGVYAVMVWSLPLVRQLPVLGVAAGSVAGLLVNYMLAQRYVFTEKPGGRDNG